MKILRLAVVVLFAAPGWGEEGATFRGDLSHSGVYPGGGVASPVAVKWKFKTDGQVLSSPAVIDGTLYVGSTDHALYAIDQLTGTEKWRFKTGGRVTSSPAVVAGSVYFGSYDGNFYAVSAATGKLRWKYQTEGERRFSAKHLHGMQPAAETMPDPFDVYLSSPTVWNGWVYFGSGDHNVYALSVASGALKWKFATGNVVHASPALADGTLYIGSWDSYFYAIDAQNGRLKWRFKTGDDPVISNQVGIQSSAAVANGLVYFGCRDSNLYALDAATGAKRWSFANHGSWVVGSPAAKEGKLYFATSDSGMFQAVDAATGVQLFSLKLKWPMFSSPTIAGGMLYIGSHEGKLFAIDLVNKSVAWVFQTDASKSNGARYTSADGGPNYAAAMTDDFYDETIQGIGRMMSVGAILSSPVVVQGALYFGSTDDYVYALG